MGVIFINPYRFGFNPLSLSPALWLDAADTSTITSSSGAVSQWNDKSGNGWHVTQSTAANQPTTGTRTINGLNVIDFDGSADVLTNTSGTTLGKNLTGQTIYYVARHDSTPTTQRLIVYISTATQSITRSSGTSGITSGKASFAGRTLDADGFQRVDSTASVSTTNAQVYTGVYDYANTDLYIYINNTLEGTNTSFQTATTTSNTDSNTFSIGALFNSTLHFDGVIAEVLIYKAAHSATQRADVYNYLAAKWGL